LAITSVERVGLIRVLGPFDHPIHYGVFAATAFGGVFYLSQCAQFSKLKTSKIGLVVLSTGLSLSTGPLLALFAQVCTIFWDKVTRGIQGRWLIFSASILGLYGTIDLMSNRTPFHVLVSYFSLNPASAYNRILIWRYGTAEVGRHPVFGIGFDEWERPTWMSSSMDNFWLLETVRFGLPGTAFLSAAIIWTFYKLARLSPREPEIHRCRAAWLTMMVGFILAGATVHFWGTTFVLFFFILGSGVWMVEEGRNHKTKRKASHSENRLVSSADNIQ